MHQSDGAEHSSCAWRDRQLATPTLTCESVRTKRKNRIVSNNQLRHGLVNMNTVKVQLKLP